ncbi:AGAP012502-PA, partial [Anopheles gambiae str. PEST]
CNLRYTLPPSSKSSATAIGNPSKPGEFSAIAAIGWTKPGGTVNWNCGGSLIWANFILTAAHCTKDRDTLLPPDIIRIGDLNLYDDREDALVQERTIIRVIRHPLYNTSSVFYDIALLMLNEKVNIYFEVMPTCLWLDDNIPFSKVEAAGWGTSGFGYGKTNILIKAELKLMANKDCESYYSQVASVKNGLMEHQLCAWDKVMDTCPGDSGGPLQHKLIFGDYKVPFLVGVTSFGLSCGNSQPGVYVKVSKFGSWIVETLQQHGERVTAAMFEPLACAGRYFYHRERYGPSIFDIRPHNVQLIWPKQPSPERCSGWETETDVKFECYGCLISTRGVVTAASCLRLRSSNPTIVRLGEQGWTNSHLIFRLIEATTVHPRYNETTGEHDIAVIKLKEAIHPFVHLFPVCLWQNTTHSPVHQAIMHSAPLTYEPAKLNAMSYDNHTCRINKQSFGASPQSLQRELFCFGNDESVAPGACYLVLGGPIYKSSSPFPYGLNLLGRDCGFGKPAVGLLLKSYKLWLESVFLQRKGQEETGLIAASVSSAASLPSAASLSSAAAVSSLDHDPNQGDQCVFNGLQSTEIDLEFNECKTRYQQFRMERQNRWRNDSRTLQYSHTAAIGFQYATEFKPVCPGYLISTRGVVTAASCLGKLSIDQMMVRLGWHGERSDPSTIRFEPVHSRNVHPLYNETTGAHNIAVIKLKNAIQPNVHLFPACLWRNRLESPVRQRILSDGDDVIERMEIFNQNSTRSHRPQADSKRNTPMFTIRKKMLLRKEAQGDSGGPLYSKLNFANKLVPFLVGVTSYGGPCGFSQPAVYVRVSKFRDWIIETIQK